MYHPEPYYAHSDLEIINKIGTYIKRLRLDVNLSQESLAIKTGLDRSSISGMENGRPASLLSLIQTLRALGKLDVLVPFFEEQSPISPMMMVKLKGKQRKNASQRRTNAKVNKKEAEW